jgi:subtilisin family serine protease
MESAVNYAVSRGVTVIAAAGNTGTQTVLYPAAYAPVIAVGAVNPELQPSSFSSYGPKIDLWAPGEGIWTTTLNAGYGALNGTSFAAPHVAGVAALEMARGRTLVVDGGIVRVSTTSIASAPSDTPTAATPTRAVTLTPTGQVDVPTLFMNTDAQGALDTSRRFGVLRSRYVSVNFAALPSDSSPQAQAAASPRVILNLFNDVILTAVNDQVSPNMLANDGLIWTGHSRLNTARSCW